MYACVALFLIFCGGISECVTVHRHWIEPETRNKVELSPRLISCKLNDIVTISVPISSNEGILYFLYAPNGDVTRLNITPSHDVEHKRMKDKYKVTNVNSAKEITKTVDIFSEGDDFVIGPLAEEDHGNWLLCVYTKEREEWVEWFQVITIEIIETVPMKNPLPEVNLGDTLELGFAYPIEHVRSCQLSVPLSTYDRFYERAAVGTCTYIVRNITAADGGAWEILAVGRIVYTAGAIVKVNNKTT